MSNERKGGKRLEEVKAVEFAEVVKHGTEIVLPDAMSEEAAIKVLQRRLDYLNETEVIHETFNVSPLDGAHALGLALREKYGWVPAEATPGFFGDKPPQMVAVETAWDKTTKVAWGSFSLPDAPDSLVTTGMQPEAGRVVFSLAARTLRKFRDVYEDLFRLVRKHVKENSLYRGKAFRVKFVDSDGDPLPWPEITFMNSREVSRENLILSEEVMAAVETNLFAPIERVRELAANGIQVKRGVLLSGVFGTGKTMAAKVAAALAEETGVTFMYIARAVDLPKAIELSKLYQDPACVIFCEDIDRETGGARDADLDWLLNTVDGIDTKFNKIMVVMTTNNADGIHQAMLRPGRLDAVIEIAPPDAEAVERLIRHYGGAAIDPDEDLVAAGKALEGKIPAIIAEVVKRAKLAQLKRLPVGKRVTKLSGEALFEAARTMTRQTQLLEPKVVAGPHRIESALKTLMRQAIEEHENGEETAAG